MFAVLAIMMGVDPLQEIKREYQDYHPAPSYSYIQKSESNGKAWSSHQWVLCNGRMELLQSAIERDGKRGGVINGRNNDHCFELMLTKEGWTLRDIEVFDSPKYAKLFGHDRVTRMLPWWGFYDAKALIELEPHEAKASSDGDMIAMEIDTVSRGVGVKGRYILNPRLHYRLERYVTTYTGKNKEYTRTRTSTRQFSTDNPLQLDAEDCTDMLQYTGSPAVMTKHHHQFTHNVSNGPELFSLANYGIPYQYDQPSYLPMVIASLSGVALLAMTYLRNRSAGKNKANML